MLLVASELGTNAVRHARIPGQLWHLAVVLSAGVVRVEVTDAYADRKPVLRRTGAEGERGRGLALVALLTGGAWGVPERAVGKTVWAEIACPAPPGEGAAC